MGGVLLQASADTFDFCIANDDVHVEDDDDISTFESSMGVRRRIDFILCSRCFHSVFVHASSFLGVGSDHWAATSCLQFRLRKPTKQNRSKTKRSEQFVGTILFCTIHVYHICSQVDGPSIWLIFFENLVLEASLQPSVHNIDGQHCQWHRADNPWRKPDFHSLLQQRKISANCDERTCLSKQCDILTWMAATRSATHLTVYQKTLIPVGHNHVKNWKTVSCQ